MKAMRYHSHGGSDVLVHEEVEQPQAGPGQVVLRVAGTTFNPLDAALRAGFVRQIFPVDLPHIPGLDVSGTVTEVGPDVTGWSVGDRAVAFQPATEPGAAAEFVAVASERLAAAPHGVDLADAAALPVAGLTARQALFDHAGLEAGQSILINGAGGGVGGYAVQLAARAGAVVTATGSARSGDRTRSFGADRVVDYTETPVLEALSGQRFDAVLQLVRGDQEQTNRLADLVSDGGTLVGTTDPVPEDVGRGVRTVHVEVVNDAARLAELVAAVDAGELKVDVAQRRPLAELPEVHDDAAAGKLTGKTVLIP